MNVSRETQLKLEKLSEMIMRWNKAINLVAPATIANLQDRHIDDSLQLMQFYPSDARRWVDIGSGGGFPGLVIAACLSERAQHCRITLIESDRRKAVFLAEAARAMGISPEIIADRVETTPLQNADVLSARALAPLDRLVDYARLHLNPNGLAIFPKGMTASEEIAKAKSAGWRFDLQQHKSLTDPAATILTLRNISFESKS